MSMHVKGTVTDPGTPCQLLGLIKMFIWKLYSPGPSIVRKSLGFLMKEHKIIFATKSVKRVREHQDSIEMCHGSLCSVDHNGANLLYSFKRKSRLVRTPDSKKR